MANKSTVITLFSPVNMMQHFYHVALTRKLWLGDLFVCFAQIFAIWRDLVELPLAGSNVLPNFFFPILGKEPEKIKPAEILRHTVKLCQLILFLHF